MATDYYPVLSRAIATLDSNNASARQNVYHRAREALVRQLHAQVPSLSEESIRAEQSALDAAIQRMETETLRANSGSADIRHPSPTKFAKTHFQKIALALVGVAVLVFMCVAGYAYWIGRIVIFPNDLPQNATQAKASSPRTTFSRDTAADLLKQIAWPPSVLPIQLSRPIWWRPPHQLPPQDKFFDNIIREDDAQFDRHFVIDLNAPDRNPYNYFEHRVRRHYAALRALWRLGLVKEFLVKTERAHHQGGWVEVSLTPVLNADAGKFCMNYRDGDDRCAAIIHDRMFGAVTGITGEEKSKTVEFNVIVSSTYLGNALSRLQNTRIDLVLRNFNVGPVNVNDVLQEVEHIAVGTITEPYMAQVALYDDGWRVGKIAPR